MCLSVYGEGVDIIVDLSVKESYNLSFDRMSLYSQLDLLYQKKSVDIENYKISLKLKLTNN